MMKWLTLLSILQFHPPQESDLDRILRQFKQARRSARSDEDYLRATRRAREAMEDYLRKNPNSPDCVRASWHHAETYLYSMEYSEAIDKFDNFVRTYPNDRQVASAQFAAVEICMRLERDAEARKRLEAWKKDHPDDPRIFRVRIFLAALLIFEKRFREAATAIEAIRTDFKGKPEEWSAAMQLVACHHVAEQNALARKILEEIIGTCPDKDLVGKARQYLREYSRLGKPLPSKKETDKEGKTLHLGAHAGKVVIFYFFTSKLPLAESEVNFLRKTRDQFSGKDLVIIGVCIDLSKRDFLTFQAIHGIPWPLFYDGDGKNGYLTRLYEIQGIPALRVLDRQGRFRFYNVSGRDLRIVVEKLLEESE